MSEPTAVAGFSAAIPAGTTVAGDLPCRRCDYNLRTLPAAGRCPECGESTASSLAAFGEVGANCTEWISRAVLYQLFVGAPLLPVGFGRPAPPAAGC
jgi:hypothetical protein